MSRTSYKHYEELYGGEDRRMRYRAPRFSADQLFPEDKPFVRMMGRDYALSDLSMTGLGLRAANDAAEAEEAGVNVGAAAPLELRYADRPVMAARGRVVRIGADADAGPTLGIQIEGSYLDIPRLSEVHRRHLIRRRLQPDVKRTVDLVPAEFRRLTADALHLLRSAKPLLQEPDAGERDLLDAVEEEITPPWLALCHEIDGILDEVERDEPRFRALKAYTESVVTPEFNDAPIWSRAYWKPMGYPGDFGILDYVYRGEDEGPTAYDKLLHRLGIESLTCVKSRMEIMADLLKSYLAAADPAQPVKISNIGCGAAEEVRRTLATGLNGVAAPVEFTLFDQDDRALGTAYERLYPHTVKSAANVSVQCLHAGFQRLVTSKIAEDLGGPQDIVYSLGILDYLKQPRAKKLCATLYSRVKPGGRLVVANVQKRPDNGRWRAECIADWHLIYRDRAQMKDLAAGLEGEAEVLTDATNNILMLVVKKPA